jgi:transcriptional regulator with XRE-family HTH domain
MNQKKLINNIIFIGLRISPKYKDNKLKNFNQSELAKYLEVNPSNIGRWINFVVPVSNTNIKRIANKASNLFNIEITPDILLTKNLETYIKEKTSHKYLSSKNKPTIIRESYDQNLLDLIIELLKKYPDLQLNIYELLKQYENLKK